MDKTPDIEHVTIRIGACSPSLYSQLQPHGITLREAAVFQVDAQAINRLYIRNFLTEAETKRARKKLAAKIFKYIQRVYEERGEAPPIRDNSKALK